MNNKPTIDDLLKLKRPERPSDGFWTSSFDPGFTRKMMAALSRPKHRSRALPIFGWSMPVVFGSALVAALFVAWLFSPEHAIARWEAEASGRQYVVDKLSQKSPSGSYKIDDSQYTLTTSNGEKSGGLTSYQFTSKKGNDSEF